jgi:hypothetical protein
MRAQQVVAVGGLVAGLALAVLLLERRAQPRNAEAGFWFDAVEFASPRLGGSLTPTDLDVVARVARLELAAAFAGLRVRVSDRPEARYRVRVVQQLLDHRVRREVAVAGESRAVPGLGGVGAVNFFLLASGAVASAPDGMERVALIEAIGRGVGRAAVHEFVHQLLPSAPIHDSQDVRSYEYGSASRREQYYGPIRWALAGPMLQKIYGPSGSGL